MKQIFTWNIIPDLHFALDELYRGEDEADENAGAHARNNVGPKRVLLKKMNNEQGYHPAHRDQKQQEHECDWWGGAIEPRQTNSSTRSVSHSLGVTCNGVCQQTSSATIWHRQKTYTYIDALTHTHTHTYTHTLRNSRLIRPYDANSVAFSAIDPTKGLKTPW